jgi:hypothetical protein
MDRVFIGARTALLIAIGALSTFLVLQESSWVFLNPRFTAFSAAGGIGLCAAGIAGLVHRSHPPRRLQIILFALLFSFLIIGVSKMETLRNTFSSGGPQSGPENRAPAEIEPDPAAKTKVSRVTRDGKEYIKISLAEMYLLTSEKGSTGPITGGRYVVRGMIKRTEQSDSIGQFVLARTAVTCCLADAVAIAFRVAADDSAALPEDFPEGTWVSVYGTVEKRPLKDASLLDIELPGIPFTALEREHVLAADTVVPVPPPEIPFMFVFSKEGPFDY